MGDFMTRPFSADPQSVVQHIPSALLSIYIYNLKCKPATPGAENGQLEARNENAQIQAEANKYICAVSAI